MPDEYPGGLPVAGWYPDPAGTPQERWWGGLNWTDHLRDTPPVAPVWPPAPSEPVTSEWPSAVAGMSGSTASGMPHATTQLAYQPMAGVGAADPNVERGRFYRPPVGSPNTGPIWFIAVSPVATVIILTLIGSLPIATLLPALAISFSVLFVALLIAVIWDSSILKQRNLPAASPAWLLLGLPIYLILRRVTLSREGIRHTAPSNVFVASVLIATAVGYLLVAPQLQRTQSAVAVASLETQSEDAFRTETSQEWTVECPDDVQAFVVGTRFSCSATSATGVSVSMSVTVTAPLRFEITEAH